MIKQSLPASQKFFRYNEKNKFEYAGASGGWIDKFGYPLTGGVCLIFVKQIMGNMIMQEEIFWASGAAFFVRANIFRELNGFDEHFFAHQEEIDLCWRMQRAGYKIYVVPSSVVYHVGGGTLPTGNERKVFLNFRNNLLMIAKNLPAARKNADNPFSDSS